MKTAQHPLPSPRVPGTATGVLCSAGDDPGAAQRLPDTWPGLCVRPPTFTWLATAPTTPKACKGTGGVIRPAPSALTPLTAMTAICRPPLGTMSAALPATATAATTHRHGPVVILGLIGPEACGVLDRPLIHPGILLGTGNVGRPRLGCRCATLGGPAALGACAVVQAKLGCGTGFGVGHAGRTGRGPTSPRLINRRASALQGVGGVPPAVSCLTSTSRRFIVLVGGVCRLSTISIQQGGFWLQRQEGVWPGARSSPLLAEPGVPEATPITSTRRARCVPLSLPTRRRGLAGCPAMRPHAICHALQLHIAAAPGSWGPGRQVAQVDGCMW